MRKKHAHLKHAAHLFPCPHLQTEPWLIVAFLEIRKGNFGPKEVLLSAAEFDWCSYKDLSHASLQEHMAIRCTSKSWRSRAC